MSIIYCEFCDRRVDTDEEVEGTEVDGVFTCERCQPDMGCVECTAGTVPDNLNTGLCEKHARLEEPDPPRDPRSLLELLQASIDAASRLQKEKRS